MHKDYTDGMQEYFLFEMKIFHLLAVVCDVPRSFANKLFSVLAFHSLENWLLGRWNAMLGATYIHAAQWDPFLPHAVILHTWNLSPLAQAHLEHQECSLFLLSFSPSFSLPLPFMGSGMEVAIPLCLFLSRNLFMCRIFLKLMGLLIHFSFWILAHACGGQRPAWLDDFCPHVSLSFTLSLVHQSSRNVHQSY